MHTSIPSPIHVWCPSIHVATSVVVAAILLLLGLAIATILVRHRHTWRRHELPWHTIGHAVYRWTSRILLHVLPWWRWHWGLLHSELCTILQL